MPSERQELRAVRYGLISAASVLATALPALAQPEPDAKPAAVDPGPKVPAPSGGMALQRQMERMIGKPGGLTSAEVARRAGKTSFTVEARRKEAEAAEAEVDKALVDIAPRLTLSARYTRLSPIDQPAFGGDSGSLVATTAPAGPLPPGAPLIGLPADSFSFPVILNQYALQASLNVPISDYVFRTARSVKGAKRTKRAAELQVRAARLDEEANARLAYYTWVRAKLQTAVTAQSVQQTRAQLVSVKRAFAAERASKADVLSIESVVASAELTHVRAQSQVTIAEEQLRTVMHDDSARSYQIGENVLVPPAGSAEKAPLRKLYAEAWRQRLELRAFDISASALDDQKAVVSAGAIPRLDAFGNVYYANPNQRIVPQEEKWTATWDVGLSLTWTPNDLGISSADTRGIEAQRAQLLAEKAALKDALRREITEAKQGMVEAKLSVTTAERGLKASRAAYDTRRKLFEYGRATSVEVIEAETSLLRARLELINAKVAVHAAKVRLDHALGRDVRDAGPGR